jgi:hypothetical protein
MKIPTIKYANKSKLNDTINATEAPTARLSKFKGNNAKKM